MNSSPVRPVWPWFAGLGLLLALDQTSKLLIRANFRLHESVAVIGEDLLRFTYVQNPGIAFGLRFIDLWILLVFGWTAAILLAVYLVRLVRRADPFRWPVFLFLAGAIGNSIDRSAFGKVTDFVDSDFPDIFMERWPVFNVADSCVTIGIALTILILIRQYVHRHRFAPTSHDRIADRTQAASDHDCAGTTAAAD